MPLFMDVHHLDEVSLADVAGAHQADLAVQHQHGVNYRRYWVDEQNGKVFCLVDAPSAEAAATVHREAHGLIADELFPVQEGSERAPGSHDPDVPRLERHALVGTLRAQAVAARATGGRVVLVVGEAGAGKTSLVGPPFPRRSGASANH